MKPGRRIISFLAVLMVFCCSFINPYPATAVSWAGLQIATTMETHLYDNSDGLMINIADIPCGEVVSITLNNQSTNLYYSASYNGKTGIVLKSAFPADVSTAYNYGVRARRQTYLYHSPDESKGRFKTYSCGIGIEAISDLGQFYSVKDGNYYGYVKKADCYDARLTTTVKVYSGTKLYKSPNENMIIGNVSRTGLISVIGKSGDFVLLSSGINVLGYARSTDIIAGIGSGGGGDIAIYNSPACTDSCGVLNGTCFVYEENTICYKISREKNTDPYYYVKKSDVTPYSFLLWSELVTVIPDPVETPVPIQPTTPSGGSSSTGTTSVNINRYDFGTQTSGGIKLKVQINGKETEVLLGLNNFTYSYDTPETVYATTAYSLRKGPEGSYGTCGRVRKGQALTIIGRDRDWLIVDLGNSKSGYILEGMTTQVR